MNPWTDLPRLLIGDCGNTMGMFLSLVKSSKLIKLRFIGKHSRQSRLLGLSSTLHSLLQDMILSLKVYRLQVWAIEELVPQQSKYVTETSSSAVLRHRN